MARIKVTSRFAILELIDRFVDNTTANDIGRTVVDESKRMISEGQSPVRGIGRFIGYSESYKTWIKGAKGDKKVRPVNLNLSGDMLAAFGFRISKKDTIEVGIIKGAEFQKEKAGYHQTGNGKMPARPIVPSDNEEFAISVMRKIRDIYGNRLAFLIRQSNKKR